MLASLLFAVLVATSSAFANCANRFGPGATDDVPHLFQLAAHDAATGNTTSLSLYAAQYDTAFAFHVMATTGPGSDDWAGLKMKYGELSMYPPTTGPDSGFAPLRYIGEDAPTEPYISPAPFLLFVNTDAYATGVFCSVPNPAGGYNLLGMNGLTNMFSLCKSSFEHTPPGPTLLFNASSTAKFVGENTYDGSSCYPVTVLIIPV